MRFLLILLTLAASLPGAVIRGIVTEAATGNPLARTVIQIEPIGGTPGGPQTTRAGDRGSFEFAGLAAGGYVLKATRPGFLPIENGQRRWNSAGFPVIVAANDAPFVALRMQRFGAITGTVRDENESGIPDFDVVAYRAVPGGNQAPQSTNRGKTDDRGVFRIAGLEPGTYLIRTAAHSDEELQFIPTFASATLQTENARPVDVFPDEEAHSIDARPIRGRLFRLSGLVGGIPQEVSGVTVTLAGEMGREVRHGTVFQFAGLAPGEYELYAEAHEDPPGSRIWGGYSRFTISRDLDGYTLRMWEVRDTILTFSPDNGRGKPPGQLYGRRRDLAGVGATAPITIANGRALLAPGGWELMFVPQSGYYVATMFGATYERGQRRRPEGWNPVLIEGFSTQIRYGLSGGGAMIAGTVKQGADAVVGAPVFLKPYDTTTRMRVGELRVTHTGLHGEWSFDGMPPGAYRLCATFEYAEPDAAALDLMGAQTLQADAHQSVTRDLELIGAQ